MRFWCAQPKVEIGGLDAFISPGQSIESTVEPIRSATSRVAPGHLLATANEPQTSSQGVDGVLRFLQAHSGHLPVDLDCLNKLAVADQRDYLGRGRGWWRSNSECSVIGGCNVGIDAHVAEQLANLAFQAIYEFGIVRLHPGILGLTGFQ
jgi:hypothetical protein